MQTYHRWVKQLEGIEQKITAHKAEVLKKFPAHPTVQAKGAEIKHLKEHLPVSQQDFINFELKQANLVEGNALLAKFLKTQKTEEASSSAALMPPPSFTKKRKR